MDLREQLARVPFRSLASTPDEEPARSTWPTRRELLVPVALFLATLATTTLANGVFYGACIVGILLVHEMGHYLMCRRYRVPSTLPYFIPLPPPISFLGTLGAVIKMRLRTGDRRILYDIGIAGPLAGLVPAIVVSIIGLKLSRVVERPIPDGTLTIGGSILFRLLERMIFGPIGPDNVVLHHPVAVAGWAGLFVTGLNLIPVGMLDGGHVVYGLLGRRSVWVSRLAVAGLAVLAVGLFQGWFVWLGLLLLLGVRHPATRFSSPGVGPQRIVLGVLTMIVFLLTFVPRPFVLPR